MVLKLHRSECLQRLHRRHSWASLLFLCRLDARKYDSHHKVERDGDDDRRGFVVELNFPIGIEDGVLHDCSAAVLLVNAKVSLAQ